MSDIKKHAAVLLALPLMALSVSALPAVLSATPAAAVDLQTGISSAKGNGVADTLFGKDGNGGTGIVTQIINVLLFIIGVVAVVMLIVGGFQYMTSQGDTGKVTTAKNTILYAIIGLVVAILAYAIVNFVLAQVANGVGGAQ